MGKPNSFLIAYNTRAISDAPIMEMLASSAIESDELNQINSPPKTKPKSKKQRQAMGQETYVGVYRPPEISAPSRAKLSSRERVSTI